MKYDSQEIAQLKAHADIIKVMEAVANISFEGNRDKRQCICPFHNDHHPSMLVDVSKGTYHCFVCGAHGDVFEFVMEHTKCDFVQAVERVAEICNFELTPETQLDPGERRLREQRSSLINANKVAAEFFHSCLERPEYIKAKEYVLSRWNQETVDHWDIGFAPEDSLELYKHFRKSGVGAHAIHESDLFRLEDQDNPKPNCCFRKRVMFPIRNNIGEIVGFTGRILPWDDQPYTDKNGKKRNPPKYVNTSNEKKKDIFVKGNILFGWNYARKSIIEANEAVLVEGNPDVIKLHEVGITNAIAACGTALTSVQATNISKACRSVVLLYDSDKAGIDATEKNGRQLVKFGMAVYVLNLPDGPDGKKQDPDSFFTSEQHFREFSSSNRVSFFEWYVRNHIPANEDPAETANLMHTVADMMAKLSEPEQLGHCAKLARIVGDKRQWESAVRKSAQPSIQLDVEGLNERQAQMNAQYGFFEKNNCYFINRNIKNSTGEQVSNFIMEPLFHIASKQSSKRIYRLRNINGHVRDIEITQKDLCSKAAFCTAVESVGNFLFIGKESDLAKIKSYLYDNTMSCVPIEQLGWQPKGQFWAWSNGIIPRDGNFIPVNELGIVKYADQYYYMPACSSINANEPEFYDYERRFCHKPSDVELSTWADLYTRTFGENAIVSISYYISSLFRDISFARYRSFPILSVFGQPGSGKTKFFMSILRMFGDAHEGASLETISPAAVGDELSKVYNGIIHFDEYKNSIKPQIIGNLKGAYEGRGRMKMAMDRDGMRMQTKLDCGVMLSGQEKTTADEALFERTLFLEFRADPNLHKLTAADFDRLKEYEDNRSLTPITNHILSFRHDVEARYHETFKMVKEEVSDRVRDLNVKSRTIECYSVILAYMRIMCEKLELPFSYEQTLDVFLKKMITQKDEMAANDPIARFWRGVKSMLFDGRICHEVDIKISTKTQFRLEKRVDGIKQMVDYDARTNCLLINPSRIFDLYSEATARTSKLYQSSLNSSDLESYLKAQSYYLGTYSTSFRKPIAKDEDRFLYMSDGHAVARAEKCSARALVFNYDDIKALYDLTFDIDPTQTNFEN